MAFPTRGTVTYTKFTLSVTSFAVSPYSGVAANDRIVIAADFRAPGTIGTPAGWTLIKSIAGGGSVGGSYYYERVCTGSETGSITFTSSTGTSAIFAVMTIQGSDPATAAQAPTAGSNGDAVALDPPSVTASWGAADNLFIAFGASSAGTMNFTGAPSGYSGLSSDFASTGGSVCNMAVAYKTSTSASDNPGTFTTSTNRFWSAMTLVFRPASGTPTTGNIKAQVGGSFVAKPVKVYISGSFVRKPLKVYKSGSWQLTNY